MWARSCHTPSDSACPVGLSDPVDTVPDVLHLHAASRIDPLAARLARVCADAPVDPMQREWIAVPSEGMRRWLSLALARHLGASTPGSGDGVAANISAAFPGSLRLSVLETGRAEGAPDPWQVERLTWSLLDVVESHATDPKLASLVELPAGGSRYGRQRRVAELFDRYHQFRPEMIRRWADDHDHDGGGRTLPSHHLWQPHLWRLVRNRLQVPSPPERMPELLDGLLAGSLGEQLRDKGGPLPGRLMVFGLTVLPAGPGFLELANAVGSTREVHLFLLEPSSRIAPELARHLPQLPPGGVRMRSEDTTARVVAHPLVRSWGRLHRETAVLLVDAARSGLPAVEQVPDPAPRRNSAAAAVADTVLGRLHADLRADTAPAGVLRPDPADTSVQFHACHGATRQVEVLRDAVLHLLADPTLGLGEDDVLIICPALERFAPTIEAVFGPSADSTRPGADHADQTVPPLRYRIADRSVRSANPVLTATSALLDLAAGRFEAPAVLDFISLAPVRTRFRFTDDDVARLSEWVTDTNVRWGLDAEHRASRGVPASIVNNTWRAATDRLLVGAAIHDDADALALGDVAPYGIESDDVVLAGRLGDLMWRLSDLADSALTARPIGEWVVLLRLTTRALFATPRDGEWQFDALLRTLGQVDEQSTSDSGASCTPLEFVDLRRLLAEQLDGAPGRPDFFRGGITISSMTPLRWVPHRVVALLGMDQSAFGSGAVDGDDLTAAVPLLGDRDTRAEARQALLESVLSAEEYLLVVRDGHDVRTNQEVPPAVVVAELRDTLLAAVHPDDRSEFGDRLEVHHPRQPFDERAFTAGALHGEQPWGFDGSALAGALARRERSSLVAPFITAPFPRDDSTVIELAELRDFLRHPIRYFLHRRLGLRLPRREDGVSALLPVGPDPLERWGIGNRMLLALLDGSTLSEWARIERRLGTMPPGALGEALIADLHEVVDQIVTAARERGRRDGPATSVPIDVQLPDGTRIVGAVLDGLAAPAAGPARVSYTSAKPEHRMAAWLDLMALTLHDPTVDWHSLGVNRFTAQGKLKLDINDLAVQAPDGDALAVATRALEVAVDLFRRGAAEPIPLFPKLSRNLFLDEARPGDWFHNMGSGDGDDPATALAFNFDYETLRSTPPLDDDPVGPDRSASRVECFADYFWGAVERSVQDRSAPGDGPDGPDGETAVDGAVAGAAVAGETAADGAVAGAGAAGEVVG